jgi:hypothetical protein
MAYDAWRAGDTWAVLVRISEAPKRRRLIRDIVTFRKTRDGYRRSQERHVLSVVTRSSVVRELRNSGFRVRVQPRYGRAPLPFRRLAFVATKPADK